jgi:2-amino-4-hydroxy-6-hydroxymethyldihydropteridine diphosphokinase
MTASRVRRAVLALGSNLGDRFGTLQAAVDALLGAPGIRAVAVSPVYETAPVGGPDQPDYLNAVLVVDTALSARALLDRALAVEEDLGRARVERWGPRTLDVDVVTIGEERHDDRLLTVPHPRAHERAFVLAPWHDAAPDAALPGHGPVADLLARTGADGVRRRDDLVLRLPPRAAGAGRPPR